MERTLLVVAALATFVFAQIYVFTGAYNDGLRVTLNEWWGVPHAVALTNGGGGGPPRKGPVVGHAEMVRPTFVLLFCVLPLLAVALLVELLRSFNVRRLSAQWALRVAQLLRRKPRVLGGWVSYWSYGEWLFVGGFLALGNVLAFYYGFSRRLTRSRAAVTAKKHAPLELDDYLELVGVTLGFNAIYNLAFLFLPATRNAAWLEFFNVSYANAIKYHRWLGVVTVATAVVHCATFYWLWVREGTWRDEALPCLDCPLDKPRGQGVWFNVFGELALLCFLAIAVTSTPFVRRRYFNAFYYTHQLLFVAVVFAVMHWGAVVWWVLPSFVLYLLGRAVSATNAVLSPPVAVQEFTALSPQLVKLVVHRAPGRDGHYKVGQFLYLNVPAVSKLQWHPFTVASSPRASSTTATVVLKALGDWTTQLVSYAAECKRTNKLPTVYVDGFYGASLEMYDEYATLCLIGGGIGVTPLLAVLEDLAARPSASQEPLPKQKVVFIFSFREVALLEELAPVLLRLRELDPHGESFVCHLTITTAPPDAMLDAKLNHFLTAASGTYAASPPQYESSTTTTPRAFSPPLRSPSFKAFAFVAVVAVAWGLLVFLEFGKTGAKIKRHGANLWPLQQFTEIAVVLLSSLVVAAVAMVERVYLKAVRASVHERSIHGAKYEMRDSSVVGGLRGSLRARESVTVSTTVAHTNWLAQALELQTYRELLVELGVRIGERSCVRDLLQQTYDQQQPWPSSDRTKSVIGVFASGPETLKRAVEVAIAEIDSGAFDLREEQFEL